LKDELCRDGLTSTTLTRDNDTLAAVVVYEATVGSLGKSENVWWNFVTSGRVLVHLDELWSGDGKILKGVHSDKYFSDVGVDEFSVESRR